MYKLTDYEDKSERVRTAMVLDDTEESAGVISRQIVDGFLNDDHFCKMTRIELDGLDESLCARGINATDSLRGEIRSIYKRRLRDELARAGFKDIGEIKHNGELWFRFFSY